MKSEKCECYNDDDGLHPCTEMRGYLDTNDEKNQHVHLLYAFNLVSVPKSRTRAIRIGNGFWEAPCGCQISDGDDPVVWIACFGIGPFKEYTQSERNTHIAKATAAVLREQSRPTLTNKDIEVIAGLWGKEHNVSVRFTKGFYEGYKQALDQTH